ncbi:MAG: hypothetical protein DMF25_00420 [Verrucomicrobia bacterium]|nr:MAG: hypothetical protein DMF25_00420 [Verrucomicrobiota bacterium]
MKKVFVVLPAIGLLVLLCSCQKQATEAERNAEVERQVNQRLEAEHQAEQQHQLTQRQAELDARENALATRESAATNTPQPQATVARGVRDLSQTPPTASYSTFYTRLEPLGVWRETSTYGYVWQPREAEQSRGWRPYTNGRWVYTEAGWTWISEEPFGWATYHYGRWARLRNIGWVWVPGDEWAPAWVSWRKGSDYVGWAPLPPEAHFDRRTGIQNWADNYYDIGPEQYCFVPTREFGAQRTERTVIPAERNVTIVNQTTNVTNITYNNTTVVNGGPSYDELRTRTQQPIERLRLERNVTVNIGTENPRPVVRGEVVEMSAPVIARAQGVERPGNVKETVAETVVDHGWETIADHQAAERVRAKMKSESTPPPNAPPRTVVKPMQAAAQIGHVSPSVGLSASPTPRSISTPVPTSVATSPVEAPSAIRAAPPKQTAPARLTQTPRPTVAMTPAATPFRREPPKISPKPTPSVSAIPPVTATPTAGEIATAPPRPTFTPRLITPARPSTELSATPSVTPVISRSTSVSPAFGRSTETNEERKTQKELRKKQKVEEQKQEFEKGKTPAAETAATPGPSVKPSASPSVAVAASEPGNKQERKKHKRAGEQREGSTETGASVSPSPSTTPQ